MATARDYYEVLGVGRSATQKEIQSAFRKLARRHHPDVNRGDEEAERRFKQVSEAHDVLSDPEKRRFYDRFGSDWQAARAAGHDADGPRPGARGRGRRTVVEDADPGRFGDIFGDLFGGAFRGDGQAGARSLHLDLEGTVAITLAEAFRGTSRQVDLPDGRRLEVRVPAGVADGTVLRVPGLLARVEIAPDPTFTRDGRDLRVTVAVPLRAALLGGEVEVPTLKGSAVRLRVPPETQNGTRLRMRGLGMPDPRGGAPGDLYAEVRVRLPLPLGEEARRLAEDLPG